MHVGEFDDRNVCDRQEHPTFQFELWSYRYDEHGEPRHAALSTYILNGCDVHEALAWAQENQSNPGCFVLYAGTWTNCGYLETLWLTGKAPGAGERSSAVTFETPQE